VCFSRLVLKRRPKYGLNDLSLLSELVVSVIYKSKLVDRVKLICCVTPLNCVLSVELFELNMVEP